MPIVPLDLHVNLFYMKLSVESRGEPLAADAAGGLGVPLRVVSHDVIVQVGLPIRLEVAHVAVDHVESLRLSVVQLDLVACDRVELPRAELHANVATVLFAVVGVVGVQSEVF